MIGNFNLPIAKGNAKTFVFTAPTNIGTGTTVEYKQWNKPTGINFIYGLVISPGQGGGGGGSLSANTGGGGGGGAPGNVGQFIQPAYLVPDTLYAVVGRGGTGGAAGAQGTQASSPASGLYYTTYPNNVATKNIYFYANLDPGSTLRGTSGSSAAAGAGTGTFTIGTAGAFPGVNGFGNFVLGASASMTGSAGSLTNAANVGFMGRPQGGAGGGGVTSGVAGTGGSVIAPSTSAQSIWSRNLSGGAATGQAGEDGITLFEPTFLSLPGAGGGGNASGTGGKGGKGGIGCGGGGGGAGVTGGAGGDGGDGLVILVCW
jgi:hypothetical protein